MGTETGTFVSCAYSQNITAGNQDLARNNINAAGRNMIAPAWDEWTFYQKNDFVLTKVNNITDFKHEVFLSPHPTPMW